ncbi:MAG: RNA-binding S4 domain-containing protein [Oscillospiraceae bacterium]|nr:RNA-binding S4 domain-containing protein [Oscillospiraceae bacterium]MBQ9959111.1 RNA-binding S4 domain-containing protein [Oscillospiraceae bacterium]
MRIDKFLKVSRIIKRRTVANEVCDAQRISVNGRPVKASYNVNIGDIVEIRMGDGVTRFEVLAIAETQNKDAAKQMYRML